MDPKQDQAKETTILEEQTVETPEIETIPKKLAAIEVQKKLKAQILTAIAGLAMLVLTVAAWGWPQVFMAGLGIGLMILSLYKAIRQKKYLEKQYQLPK